MLNNSTAEKLFRYMDNELIYQKSCSLPYDVDIIKYFKDHKKTEHNVYFKIDWSFFNEVSGEEFIITTSHYITNVDVENIEDMDAKELLEVIDGYNGKRLWDTIDIFMDVEIKPYRPDSARSDNNDVAAVVLNGDYSRQNMVGTEIKEDTGYFLCEIIDQNISKEDILKRMKLGFTHQYICSIEFTADYDFDDLAELSKSELLGIIVNVTAIDNNIPF